MRCILSGRIKGGVWHGAWVGFQGAWYGVAEEGGCEGQYYAGVFEVKYHSYELVVSQHKY